MRFWSRRYAPVWFDPMPKQRVFLETRCKERFGSGGIRSGKSEMGACEMALLAWGVKGLLYPGWPKDGKKRDFWAVALSVDKLRDTVRKKLGKMLGPRARWREAEHTFVLPQGSTVECKTQEADADKFQSVDIDGAWFDEIGRDAERYEHTKDRLIDRRGLVWTTYAPTRGMGWYYTAYERWSETTNGKEVVADEVLFLRLFTEDNVYLPKTEVAWRKKALATDTDLRVKFYGEHVELRGLVFPTFDPARHVLRCLVNGRCSRPPEKRWRVVRGHDYGKRYPAACAWLGYDPRERTVTVYREHYVNNQAVPQICFVVLGKSPPEEDVILDVADPSLWNEEPMPTAVGKFVRLKDMYHEHGVRIVPGNNRFQPGVELITQLLGQRDAAPRLLVHECCVNGIREFRRYHWPEGGAESPSARAAMGDDHFLDALRYGLMALKPYLDGGEPSGGFDTPALAIETRPDGDPVVPDSRVLVPTVHLVEDPGGYHHYEWRWAAPATGDEDGFDL